MGEPLPVHEIPRVASLWTIRRGSDPRGWPPVHRDIGGGSVRHCRGRRPTESYVHEEHGALPKTDQNAVSVKTQVKWINIRFWRWNTEGRAGTHVKRRVTITANIYQDSSRVIGTEVSLCKIGRRSVYILLLSDVKALWQQQQHRSRGKFRSDIMCESQETLNGNKSHAAVVCCFFVYFSKNNLDDLICCTSAVIRQRSRGFTSNVAAKVSASTSWRRSPRRSSSPTTFTWSPMENTARRSTGRGTAWWERWGVVLPLCVGFLRTSVSVTFAFLPSCLRLTVACIYEGGKWPNLEGLLRINVHSVESCLLVFVIAMHV